MPSVRWRFSESACPSIAGSSEYFLLRCGTSHASKNPPKETPPQASTRSTTSTSIVPRGFEKFFEKTSSGIDAFNHINEHRHEGQTGKKHTVPDHEKASNLSRTSRKLSLLQEQSGGSVPGQQSQGLLVPTLVSADTVWEEQQNPGTETVRRASASDPASSTDNYLGQSMLQLAPRSSSNAGAVQPVCGFMRRSQVANIFVDAVIRWLTIVAGLKISSIQLVFAPSSSPASGNCSWSSAAVWLLFAYFSRIRVT